MIGYVFMLPNCFYAKRLENASYTLLYFVPLSTEIFRCTTELKMLNLNTVATVFVEYSKN